MSRSPNNDASLAAVISSGAMIAFQIGGKATRDALFLSNFPVTALPGALVSAALVSVVSVILASKAMGARGPRRVVPYAFGLSSILLLVEWFISGLSPRVAAVLFYLHMASFGAVLISGFWSMITESFDPHTAKIEVARIASAGTAGGIVGGVLAERTGAMFSATAMLPVLATLHMLCAVLNIHLRRSVPVSTAQPSTPESFTATSGLRVLSNAPYVRNLAYLVLLGTVAENLLDYVLKTQATLTFGRGDELIRFFGLFYTVVSLLTFVVQWIFSRYSLERLGLAGTISTMPLMVVFGGLASLIAPGLGSIGFAKGGESVLRSSLFRSGYELLYAPVPARDKRAAKTIVDVGFDRLGDAVGGGVIRGLVALNLTVAPNNRLLILLAVALAALSLIFARKIRAGYVSILEKSLIEQAQGLDMLHVDEKRGTVLLTLATIDGIPFTDIQKIQTPADAKRKRAGAQAQDGDERTAPADPLTGRLANLRSSDSTVVRSALSGPGPLDPLLIPAVIRLLARDDLRDDTVSALRKVAAIAVGQFTDALLNPDEDFAVRRRIPRVLASYPSERSVQALLGGLADARFEVRFHCGRALSNICALDESLRPDPNKVFEAALAEIRVAERLSEPPRMLDGYEEKADVAAEALWTSTDIRLEHVFRLLSLSLPREPLHVAFQALHTENAYLRGTALEYLDSVLPPGVRDHIWQFLEGPVIRSSPAKPADVVLRNLMTSRSQIEQNLISES
jgi:ATP:ADP antiporter, AAA family